ncbi:MAG: LamG domain-containing protein [Sedimentisphaerales bacterium]|nr:LamG domain-containing protein [Sedimentisphaerales bacterium]HNY77102.1 LamG domain-containing protein [Sedimentisphaerales bacterium]HOC62482.1 LamG domain-containing protein [Sedimentisphaerales bacterium]HOH63000.1 LamG domain-containing protein [Sedimentisphaerales bacterium]HQA90428.1 LamG domain-containing protein [Sedimentisphaerales bacterium]
MFKRLMVLILLLAALSVTAPAAQAQLITAVAHRNTDADATEDPQIAPNPLDEGALTFVDRTHIYADVPEFIIGAEYIMLANDNKNMSAYEVDITLAKSAIVYVFVDNRMGGAAGGLGVDPIITGMPWLTDMGFVDIGEDIGIDESADGSINQYFSIFALEVKAGVVTIGGCTEGHSGNMLGAAVLPAPTSETATNPVPADAATDVVREIVLQWTPGETAVTHDVYLGTVFDDVNTASRANPLGVLVSQGQSDASYDPDGLLEFGTTYYWRIDEVNAPPDSTIFKGEVWSFTTEPFAYPITGIIATSNAVSNAGVGPERTIDGSGLDAADGHSTDASDMWLGLPAGDDPVYIQYEFDKVYKLYEMWVWNYNVQFEPVLGFGLKNVTIEYSADGADWTALGDAELARASAQAGYAHNSVVDLQGVAARSVRLTVNSNWGMLAQYGLSEVRFFYVPVQAREPQPADAATSIDPDTVLSWRAGREATSHEVYFGTRPEELLLVDTVDQSSSTPGELDLGATYYWRVDEIGEETWVGEVWSFSTLEYVMVDGFEDYNDDLEAGTTIFDTWLDGWVNETGSTVGYLNAPFAERTIVHSGVQSMPLQYDNSGSSSYSETERQFEEPQDWTANGIKSLSLYFRGAADNTGQMYVKINNTKIAYNGDPADIAKTAWLPWNIDLSAVGNLRNVTTLIIGIEGSGSKGILYIDDIRLYPKAPEFITPTEPDAANLLARYEFEGNANDSSGNGLNGTIRDGQFVASGRPGNGMALQVNDAGYADLGNPALLDFSTGDWTVTAWYKTGMTGTGDENKGTIYGKGGDTGGGHRYCLIMSETTEGVVTLVTDDDVTKYVINSASVTNDDEWHSVAGQRQGVNLRIFIDGALEGTAVATEQYNLAGTSQHNAYIGAITDHTAGGLYKLYIGLLDDVRVYDKALSEGEILWLAGVTTPVAKPF